MHEVIRVCLAVQLRGVRAGVAGVGVRKTVLAGEPQIAD